MGMQWDLFCRVIDNYGDIGVSWRLARDLAARGQGVRLWLDDAAPLQWMAPQPRPAGIEVLPWGDPAANLSDSDVVIETFGCELPEAFIARMAAQAHPPLWINLEYLSAEAYVERSHGLASPQFSGPGRGLAKSFFYPGFTERTGGLLREPGLLQAQAGFDAQAWLAAQGVQRPTPETQIVSLFAYPNGALPDLLASLAQQDCLLLVCAGQVQEEMLALSRAQALPAGLLWQALPYLSQNDFDHLLWACDFNFVRGEDSFVRAQWAGKPFVWQIYPQTDGAHAPKLEAFMDRWLAGADSTMAADYRQLWRSWNGLQAWQGLPWPGTLALRHAQDWRDLLTQQNDLTSQLLGLAHKTS
ncbi:elongation factor P maturation arginine rhamnosyltransferase EarP [Roseateles sp. PN1]|uniref:elongation factor P maturation arginine rhamnosyltransferase EarP n=1 Tax=Roseateles sp. PN1 TaxID=3137372 RepID=UPI003139541F